MGAAPATAGTATGTAAGARPSSLAWLKRVGKWLAVLLMAGTFGFPLYWTVTMSFKPQEEWNPPGKVFWFPHHPTVSNFTDILGIAQESSIFFSGRSRSAL